MFQTLDTATRRLYILLLFAFAVFGMIMTIAGAALPQIIRTFHWSYTIMGLVLAASSLGYVFSTFLSGILAQKIAPKAVLIAGVIIGAVGMSLFVRWPSPWLNLLFNLAVGLCQGALEVIGNLEIIHMERNGQSRLMNLSHSAFCIGALGGPLALGYILKSGYSVITVFAVAGALLALLAVLFAVTRFPRVRQEPGHEEREGLRLLRQPLLLLLIIMFLLYVGCEIGVSSWTSEFFVTLFGATASTGAFIVALFWVGLLIGRVGISFFYKGTRQENLMLAIISTSAAALLVALLAHSTAAVAVAIVFVGLGFSGFYPLAMTVVGRYYKSGMAVGSAAAGGATGSVVFPFIMALLSQTVGMRGGFWFYLGLNLLLVGLTAVLVRMVHRRRRGKA
ncbi:MAG: MFS transporter [Spirochaetia bacterium]